MTTATIKGLREIASIPQQGQQTLSVDASMVDVGEVWQFAREFGFSPELVQVRHRSNVQVHILLWQGAIADAPSELDERIDALADRVDPDAIHSVRGGVRTPQKAHFS